MLAVADVTPQVREGEFVSIIGPSGCGKSTLFNIVGGMIADYAAGDDRRQINRILARHPNALVLHLRRIQRDRRAQPHLRAHAVRGRGSSFEPWQVRRWKQAP